METKHTGAAITFGFFRNSEMKEISAVIFSNTATFGKLRALAKPSDCLMIFAGRRYNAYGANPTDILAKSGDYQESLLDGLHIFLNPFAEHTLNTSMYEDREIAIHTYDITKGAYLPKAPHGFLLQRAVMEIQVGEESPSVATPRTKGKDYVPPAWEEGVFHSIGGTVGQYNDHYIAHYRGWTVVVAFDRIDNEWGAQGSKGRYRTLPEFIAANRRDDMQFFLPKHWFGTKEEAFADGLRAVDVAPAAYRSRKCHCGSGKMPWNCCEQKRGRPRRKRTK